MAGTNEKFLILAESERLPDFTLVTEITANFLKLNRAEAALAARHSWGFLGEDLDEGKAQELLRLCAVYGIGTVELSAPELPKLEAPLRIKKLTLEQDSLIYTEANGESDTLPKEDVKVLAAAPIRIETTRMVTAKEGPSTQERAVRLGIMAVTGLPIGLGKSKEVTKAVKSSETAFHMDIILKNTGRLRFCSDDFDFSYLAAEKTYSSQLNFRLMAARLAAFLPKALKNAGLWAIIESKPLSALPYDSIEDFEIESLRLLALTRLKQ